MEEEYFLAEEGREGGTGGDKISSRFLSRLEEKIMRFKYYYKTRN